MRLVESPITWKKLDRSEARSAKQGQVSTYSNRSRTAYAAQFNEQLAMSNGQWKMFGRELVDEGERCR
jgi:hypothetical protein